MYIHPPADSPKELEFKSWSVEEQKSTALAQRSIQPTTVLSTGARCVALGKILEIG